MATVSRQRRDLLKLMGAGAVAMAFPDHTLHAAGPRPGVALQLYTVRKTIDTDFDGTIRRVAEVGFRAVETYSFPPTLTPQHAASVFNSHGIQVIGMHAPFPVGADRETVLRTAEAYRCDRVILPSWSNPESYKTRDAIRRMADVYNEMGKYLASQGLRFGLHNHWMEFEMQEGFFPFYYLHEHLDKSIFFEIDTYWARTAGKDPAKVLRDFGARVQFLHIKDGPAEKGEPATKQLPAGEGVLNFPAIARAGGKNIRWMVVEFDDYAKDIFEGIRQSYSFLTSRGLAK
jgi:sugar phosphate isomerase/epimerase